MAPLPTLPTTVPPLSAAGTVSSNDALIDLFMERAVDLLRLEAGTRDRVIALLDALERELIAAISTINPTGPARVRYQRDRLLKLQELVENTIRATYRTSDVLLAQEVRNLVDIEATWTARAINAAIHVEFADAGLTRGLLDTLVSNVLIQGAPTKEWWSRQAQGLADKFADEMRRGVALGEPNSKLIERLRGTRTTRGLMDISRTSAERLVRASVQTAANAARTSTYDQNADLIAAVQWHATLDTRTSLWCITRDGKHYTIPDHKPIGDAPPWLEGPGALHWGCRSTSVPILKSWRDLGIDEDEVPETTRASMDGQVPAEMTFEAWLKKQSQTRQDTVLGEGKADLWRRGKITFRDLLDQNGRPLTTDELRARSARN